MPPWNKPGDWRVRWPRSSIFLAGIQVAAGTVMTPLALRLNAARKLGRWVLSRVQYYSRCRNVTVWACLVQLNFTSESTSVGFVSKSSFTGSEESVFTNIW